MFSSSGPAPGPFPVHTNSAHSVLHITTRMTLRIKLKSRDVMGVSKEDFEDISRVFRRVLKRDFLSIPGPAPNP